MTTLTEWERRVPSDAPLVIVGAGNLCESLFDKFPAGVPGHKLLAITDNDIDKQFGRVIGRHLITGVGSAVEVYGDQPFYVVLIHLGFKDVKAQLIGLGVPEDRIVHWWILWQHYSDLKMPEWADVPEPPAGWLDVWSDEVSRRVAQNAYDFFKRYSDRTAEFAPSQTYSLPDDIYFDRTIYAPAERERLLDIGAFDGDTIAQFFSLYADRFCSAMAVEGSPQNFDRLSELWGDHPAVTCVHAAVVAEKIAATVDWAGHGVSAKLGEGVVTDVLVPATTIDKLCRKFSPTVVKLDIEGAELAALHGGIETIKRCRPVIACCLYHRPSDLWTIATYLAGELTDYTFHARCYDEGSPGFEVVMYAVPAGRGL